MERIVTSLLIGVLALAGLTGCQNADASGRGLYRVGYVDDPLLAPLFVAQAGSASWESVRARSSADVGYALLADEVDAGFVELSRARQLLDGPGGGKLLVAGSIEFPYGATLVVRDGLDIRLDDLVSRKIAVQAQCGLLRQFEADTARSGVATESLTYENIPFADMLPALEAGLVDAILVKSAHAALAQRHGHDILYQNWEVAEGQDVCCPPSVAQTEYLLLVDSGNPSAAISLAEDLLAANDAPASELRAAVASATGTPREVLENHPIATFARLTEEQREVFGEDRCLTIP